MTALKAHEVDAFLKRDAKSFRLFLVYGPDTGLVNERCAGLAKLAGGANASIKKFDADEIAADPATLMDEAQSIGLFGDNPVLWLRAGNKKIEDIIAPLVENPPPDMALIVEAGELKSGAPLRKLFETAKNAVALPCYADDARDLARLIDDELREAGMMIESDAKRVLAENLGGDRQATRQEIRKLCLYALGQDKITLEDVMAVSGDVSALALDEILDELGLGQASHVLAETQRHMAHGTHGSVLLGLALRHMMMLQMLRYDVDNGRATTEAIKSATPPIFFKRQPKIERQLVMWPLPKITRALEVLNEAILKTRQLPDISDALSERALMDVALMAQAR
ncbi:MAG: DNA polymerase III subunit delta [Pseudomonadota bacterium]